MVIGNSRHFLSSVKAIIGHKGKGAISENIGNLVKQDRLETDTGVDSRYSTTLM